MIQEETDRPDEETAGEKLENEEGTPPETDEIDDGCGKTKP